MQELIDTFKAVATGIALRDEHLEFIDYTTGLFDAAQLNLPELPTLTHAVALVGYTPHYWILRNSWGASWGEQGHMFLKRQPPDLPMGMRQYVAFAS